MRLVEPELRREAGLGVRVRELAGGRVDEPGERVRVEAERGRGRVKVDRQSGLRVGAADRGVARGGAGDSERAEVGLGLQEAGVAVDQVAVVRDEAADVDRGTIGVAGREPDVGAAEAVA